MMLPVVVVFLLLLASGPSRAVDRQFLQISDIHLDVDYVENGDVSEMCHSSTDRESVKASKFGSYKCDAPKLLVESAFIAMKNFTPNPEFILWTGDNSPHLNTSHSRVMDNLKFVIKRLSNQYPGVPIVPVLGNHDSSPADNFPDSNNSPGQKYYSDYITDGSFGDILKTGSEAAEKFKECGYYVIRNKTYDVNITQTFIVLNTALYYHNKALDSIHYPLDPCEQFAWLETQLRISKPNERVFIVAHVPPGYFEHHANEPMFSNENYTRAYMDIITNKDNAKKIVAHFYGHTHTDSFRLFMGQAEPMGVAFIAPSITPLVWVREGVNPSFRTYTYNHVERKIMSYTQHYLPLEELIKPEENDPDYKDDTEMEVGRSPADRQSLNSKFLSKREVDEDETALAAENTTDINDAVVNETVTDIPSDVDDSEESVTINGTDPPIIISNEDDGNAIVNNATVVPSPIAINETDMDPDLDRLVKAWQFGYNAAIDFNLDALTEKGLYRVYNDMRSKPSGFIFKQFWRHAFVLRDHSDGLDCNSTCHAQVVCAIRYITKEDFTDCLAIHDVDLPILPNPDEAAATTTTTTTMRAPLKPLTTTKQTVWTNTPPVEPKDDETSAPSHVIRGIVIGLAFVALIIMGILGVLYYQKIRRRRYCSQEFLLDSFRYDGYSQVDQP